MIIVKSAEEIEIMRESCRIAAQALKIAGESVAPGITTAYINKVVHDYIISQKATPSFLNYSGFPASACVSVNEEVIHGIPSATRVLKEGDIVSVDVGAFFNGFHSDNAATFAVGRICEEVARLLATTKRCLQCGIDMAVVGGYVGDISHAVQLNAESAGFSVVKEYVGHGVGRNLHEEPPVPNCGELRQGAQLVAGMTLAVEPMINMGKSYVKMQKNGWGVVTRDSSFSAHFEHTILITDLGPQVLTRV
ncbi:MAG: type I methionyl aminopeptidase [Oscillospiraceae bacterium]|jgi:methionyl aminopeptidase|nr:type I methionyl aminopeptidase [Oscillospiraceae bacterium]